MDPPDSGADRRSKWWAWGDARKSYPLPEEARRELFARLGMAARAAAPPPALPALPEPAALQPPCPSSMDAIERLVHSTGMSFPDLVRRRSGRVRHAPDAVLLPGSAVEVAAALAWAVREDVAVIPFGGGTSVVGSVEPLRGSHRAAVSLDLRGLGRVLEVDERSGLARAECGCLGPALESELQARGWSLGHFPQSFEFSTLGGWIATRSAGQCSTRHGKIEDLVRAVRCVSPAGEIVTREVPASATGPELREVLVGSEGTLGVFVEATVRIHRRPERMEYRSYLFRAFAEGMEAAREVLQSGLRPAVLRLSDEPETAIHLLLSGASHGAGVRLLRLLGRRPWLEGAHLLLGFEVDASPWRAEARAGGGIARRHGGLLAGPAPGRRFERERFDHPYLRDTLLDLGILVETLETAAPWARLPDLYAAVRAAIGAPLVLCHLSHAYPDGASLYFTFLADAPDPDQALEHWQRIKVAAGDAILRAGGTISHHHGVGADHRRWLQAERGPLQMQMLRALKRELDPAGILNPGKLVVEG